MGPRVFASEPKLWSFFMNIIMVGWIRKLHSLLGQLTSGVQKPQHSHIEYISFTSSMFHHPWILRSWQWAPQPKLEASKTVNASGDGVVNNSTLRTFGHCCHHLKWPGYVWSYTCSHLACSFEPGSYLKALFSNVQIVKSSVLDLWDKMSLTYSSWPSGPYGLMQFQISCLWQESFCVNRVQNS